MKRILVVCAHPDDETLGMGGTISQYAKQKDQVFVLVLSEGESNRNKKSTNILQRKKQAIKACAILGVKKTKFLNYADQKLDTVALSELSKKIESVIKDWDPDIVYTHYWNDLNQDHRQTFEATAIAVRPQPKSKISQFICFETPSSSEWAGKNYSFSPNMFINIEKTIKNKLKAFAEYKDEVMRHPHPRSKEAVIYRAKFWGNGIGVDSAEAFIIIREIR